MNCVFLCGYNNLRVLRNYFQGLYRNKICFKLPVEGMFALHFFVRALIVPIQLLLLIMFIEILTT